MNLRSVSPKSIALNLRKIPSHLRRSLPEYRFFAYLAVLGPGIIAAASGDEASGIATYSSAGADYGYTLLWTFIPMTVFFIVAQEMCVRMGVVTGQGLADLIREQFGVRWTALVMLAPDREFRNHRRGICRHRPSVRAFRHFALHQRPVNRRRDLALGRPRNSKTHRAGLPADGSRAARVYCLGYRRET